MRGGRMDCRRTVADRRGRAVARNLHLAVARNRHLAGCPKRADQAQDRLAAVGPKGPEGLAGGQAEDPNHRVSSATRLTR